MKAADGEEKPGGGGGAANWAADLKSGGAGGGVTCANPCIGCLLETDPEEGVGTCCWANCC